MTYLSCRDTSNNVRYFLFGKGQGQGWPKVNPDDLGRPRRAPTHDGSNDAFASVDDEFSIHFVLTTYFEAQ